MWGEDQQSSKLRNSAASSTQAAPVIKQRPLPQKLLDYITSLIWVSIAIACLYYTNFFYQLFHSPKIYEPFFTISMTCYFVFIVLTVFVSLILPNVYKIQNVEDYNPRIIPIATVFAVVAIISLLIAIWPVWGYTSLLIFIALWKGFFQVSTFLPSGNLGAVLFILVNTLGVLSYKIIEHEGYLH